MQATKLVEPGRVQDDIKVPGEDSVPVDMTDVFAYADALAKRNGFYGLRNEPLPDLRNPDIVFPGDVLTLPDGRLVGIEPGETIWKVATRHYRKDFARISILARQYRVLAKKYEDDEDDEILAKMKRREGFMKRLAITPSMKEVVIETLGQ